MEFITLEQVAERYLRGRSVALVGSAPSVIDNEPGFIDSHEVVVRVNNYKLNAFTGMRTDVYYSFFGGSIRKTRDELLFDGVKCCMCKCPNSKPIESPWHEQRGKQIGIDFRYIYERRKDFWFCDTYVPTDEWFRDSFKLLRGHVPSTGFAALLDVLACGPKTLYLTGYDFFSSGIHNVDERWRPGDPADPIGHDPSAEASWLKDAVRKTALPLMLDKKLRTMLGPCHDGREQQGQHDAAH